MREETKNWLDERRISEIECVIPDMTGNARGKFMPADKFAREEGIRLPESLFIQTVTGDWPDDESMIDPTEQDMILRPIPVDIHHGRSDPVVPFSEAELARDTLTGLGHTVFFNPFDGGHTTSAAHAAEIWANIGGLSL